MQKKLLAFRPYTQPITDAFLESLGFTPTFYKRFWKYVSVGDGCWNWVGYKNAKGYGHIGKGRLGASQMKAHRASWILFYGPIPNEMCVLHNCPGGDNSSCVNPKHLWLGTVLDNNQDMIQKGRKACGDKVAKKVNSDLVRQIRKLYSNGGTTQKAIGKMFGIHQTGVGKMIRRETWTSVD